MASYLEARRRMLAEQKRADQRQTVAQQKAAAAAAKTAQRDRVTEQQQKERRMIAAMGPGVVGFYTNEAGQAIPITAPSFAGHYKKPGGQVVARYRTDSGMQEADPLDVGTFKTDATGNRYVTIGGVREVLDKNRSLDEYNARKAAYEKAQGEESDARDRASAIQSEQSIAYREKANAVEEIRAIEKAARDRKTTGPVQERTDGSFTDAEKARIAELRKIQADAGARKKAALEKRKTAEAELARKQELTNKLRLEPGAYRSAISNPKYDARPPVELPASIKRAQEYIGTGGQADAEREELIKQLMKKRQKAGTAEEAATFNSEIRKLAGVPSVGDEAEKKAKTSPTEAANYVEREKAVQQMRRILPSELPKLGLWSRTTAATPRLTPLLDASKPGREVTLPNGKKVTIQEKNSANPINQLDRARTVMNTGIERSRQGLAGIDPTRQTEDEWGKNPVGMLAQSFAARVATDSARASLGERMAVLQSAAKKGVPGAQRELEATRYLTGSIQQIGESVDLGPVGKVGFAASFDQNAAALTANRKRATSVASLADEERDHAQALRIAAGVQMSKAQTLARQDLQAAGIDPDAGLESANEAATKIFENWQNEAVRLKRPLTDAERSRIAGMVANGSDYSQPIANAARAMAISAGRVQEGVSKNTLGDFQIVPVTETRSVLVRNEGGRFRVAFSGDDTIYDGFEFSGDLADKSDAQNFQRVLSQYLATTHADKFEDGKNTRWNQFAGAIGQSMVDSARGAGTAFNNLGAKTGSWDFRVGDWSLGQQLDTLSADGKADASGASQLKQLQARFSEMEQFKSGLAQGAGQLAYVMSLGRILAPLGVAAQTGGLWVTNAAQMGQYSYDDAIAAGADEETAAKVFYRNAVVGGSLETLGDMVLMGGVKAVGKLSARAPRLHALLNATAVIAEKGAAEGLTEAAQDTYANIVARDFYDKNRSALEGIGLSAAIGFFLGAGASTPGSVVHHYNHYRAAERLKALRDATRSTVDAPIDPAADISAIEAARSATNAAASLMPDLIGLRESIDNPAISRLHVKDAAALREIAAGNASPDALYALMSAGQAGIETVEGLDFDVSPVAAWGGTERQQMALKNLAAGVAMVRAAQSGDPDAIQALTRAGLMSQDGTWHGTAAGLPAAIRPAETSAVDVSPDVASEWNRVKADLDATADELLLERPDLVRLPQKIAASVTEHPVNVTLADGQSGVVPVTAGSAQAAEQILQEALPDAEVSARPATFLISIKGPAGTTTIESYATGPENAQKEAQRRLAAFGQGHTVDVQPVAQKAQEKPAKAKPKNVRIANLPDLIKNGGGKVEVVADGRAVNYKTFTLTIDGNIAEVAFVELDPSERGAGIGLQAYKTLAAALAVKGITLRSSKGQYAAGKALWQKLAAEGLAKPIGQGAFEWTGEQLPPLTQEALDAYDASQDRGKPKRDGGELRASTRLTEPGQQRQASAMSDAQGSTQKDSAPQGGLSEAEREALADEKAKQMGLTKVWRSGDIDTLSGDGGIHFGTQEQANDLGDKPADTAKPYYLDLTGAVRMIDFGHWKDEDFWNQGYDPKGVFLVEYLNRHEGLGKGGAVDLDGNPLSPVEQDQMSDKDFKKANPRAQFSYLVRDLEIVFSQDRLLSESTPAPTSGADLRTANVSAPADTGKRETPGVRERLSKILNSWRNTHAKYLKNLGVELAVTPTLGGAFAASVTADGKLALKINPGVSLKYADSVAARFGGDLDAMENWTRQALGEEVIHLGMYRHLVGEWEAAGKPGKADTYVSERMAEFTAMLPKETLDAVRSAYSEDLQPIAAFGELLRMYVQERGNAAITEEAKQPKTLLERFYTALKAAIEWIKGSIADAPADIKKLIRDTEKALEAARRGPVAEVASPAPPAQIQPTSEAGASETQVGAKPEPALPEIPDTATLPPSLDGSKEAASPKEAAGQETPSGPIAAESRNLPQDAAADADAEALAALPKKPAKTDKKTAKTADELVALHKSDPEDFWQTIEDASTESEVIYAVAGQVRKWPQPERVRMGKLVQRTMIRDANESYVAAMEEDHGKAYDVISAIRKAGGIRPPAQNHPLYGEYRTARETAGMRRPGIWNKSSQFGLDEIGMMLAGDGYDVAAYGTGEAAVLEIMKAALNGERVLRTPDRAGSELYASAGVRANLPQFMADSLETAQAMAAAGKSSEEIRALTGWFPGKYDGKMRWEIPDEWAKIGDSFANEVVDAAFGGKTYFTGRPLASVLWHKPLFDAYPDIRNVRVYWTISETVSGRYGSNRIGVTAPTLKDGLSTLLHEIQHWIQQKEGFAKGGNPNFGGAFDESVSEALRKSDSPALLDALSEYEQSQMDGDVDSFLELLKESKAKAKKFGDKSAAVLRFLDARRALANEVLKVGVLTMDQYRRVAGEIEARDVQARQSFTPEQRAAIAPYSSENIAPESAIVLFAGSTDLPSPARFNTLARKVANGTATPEEHAEFRRAERAVGQASLFDEDAVTSDALPAQPDWTQNAVQVAARKSLVGTMRATEGDLFSPNGLAVDTSGQMNLFAGRTTGPFYSQLERTITAKMPERADAAQILGIIRNPQNRVKEDELKWSGIVPWLEAQKSPVTKEAVQQYLAGDGAVRFEEVTAESNVAYTVIDREGNSRGQFAAVEQARQYARKLLAVHNTSPGALRQINELGGFAVPSIAVVRPEVSSFTNFGEISLVARPDMIDPRNSAKSKVFNADVYSPRFPPMAFKVSRRDFGRALGKMQPVAKRLGMSEYFVDESDVSRKGFDAFANEAVPMAAFLESKGIPFEPVMERLPDLPDALKQFRLESRYGDDPGLNAAVKQVILANQEAIRTVDPTYTSSELDAEGEPEFRAVNRYRELIWKNQNPAVSHGSTRDAARRLIEDSGLNAEFNQWVKDTFRDVIAQKQVIQYNEDTGARKNLPYNLDSVVKIMKRGVRDSEGFNYGVGSIRARVAKQYKSLSAMRQDADKIVAPEQIEAMKEQASKDLLRIADELQPYYAGKIGFGYMDEVSETLKDIAAGRRAPMFKDIPEDTMRDIRGFLDALRTMPTEYFEAKLQHGVGLNEFAAAIIPDDTDKDVREIIGNAGLATYEYPRGDTEARKQAMRSALQMDGSLLFASPVRDIPIPAATAAEAIKLLGQQAADIVAEGENDTDLDATLAEHQRWLTPWEHPDLAGQMMEDAFHDEAAGIPEPRPDTVRAKNLRTQLEYLEAKDAPNAAQVKRMDWLRGEIEKETAPDGAELRAGTGDLFSDAEIQAQRSASQPRLIGSLPLFADVGQGELFGNASSPEAVPASLDEISQKIADARAAGVKLSESDETAVREAWTRHLDFSRKANRMSGAASDPMRKGNAFPMGVGFTRMTKRASQRIDASVKKAGIAVQLSGQAKAALNYVDAMLAGKGTEADKALKAERRIQFLRTMVKKLIGPDAIGTTFAKFRIEKVNLTNGIPLSFNISGEGVIKGVDDKVNVVKEIFGGDRALLEQMVEEERFQDEGAELLASSPSLTAQDAEYLTAVEAGDMETAQRMVDEAAKAAGYNSAKVMHGTAAKFDRFDTSKRGDLTEADSAKAAFFFTDGYSTAQSYAERSATLMEDKEVKSLLAQANVAERRGDWDLYERLVLKAEELEFGENAEERRKSLIKENATIYSVYLKGDFLKLDAEGNGIISLRNAADFKRLNGSLVSALNKAKRLKKDGVLISNFDDGLAANEVANHWAVFEPSQIKSADPVTRDESGNVIPLSQRFNPASESILYASSPSLFRQPRVFANKTPAQVEADILAARANQNEVRETGEQADKDLKAQKDGQAGRMASFYRDFIQGRLDRAESVAPGSRRAIMQSGIEQGKGKAAARLLRETLNARIDQVLPKGWWNFFKRRTAKAEFLDDFGNVARRLNATAVDSDGQPLFSYFERKAGYITAQKAELTGWQPGEIRPVQTKAGARKRRLGDAIETANGEVIHILYEPLTEDDQKKFYEWFSKKWAEGVPMLDLFIDPTLEKARFTSQAGIVMPIFNRHSLADFYRESPFGPLNGELPGYVPDVVMHRSLVSATLKALKKMTGGGGQFSDTALTIRLSGGRTLKTGAAAESGNVQDIISAFGQRAMEAHSEKVQRELVLSLLQAGLIPIDPNIGVLRDHVAFGKQTLNQVISTLYFAAKANPNLENLLTAIRAGKHEQAFLLAQRLGAKMSPADRREFNIWVDRARESKSKGRTLNLFDETNPGVNPVEQRLAALMLGEADWLKDKITGGHQIHNAVLEELVNRHAGASALSWYGKLIEKMLGEFQAAKLAGLGTPFWNYIGGMLQTVSAANTFAAQAAAMRLVNPKESKRLWYMSRKALRGVMTNRWIYRKTLGAIFGDIGTEINRYAPAEIFESDGITAEVYGEMDGKGVLQLIASGRVASAIVKATGQQAADAAWKQNMYFSALLADAMIAADNAGIKGKKERYEFAKQHMMSPSKDAEFRAKSLADFYLFNMADVPRWMDSSRPYGRTHAQRILSKWVQRLVFQFMRWPYNQLRYWKRTNLQPKGKAVAAVYTLAKVFAKTSGSPLERGAQAITAVKQYLTKPRRLADGSMGNALPESSANLVVWGVMLAIMAGLDSEDDDSLVRPILGSSKDAFGEPVDYFNNTAQLLNVSKLSPRTDAMLRGFFRMIGGKDEEMAGMDLYQKVKSVPYIPYVAAEYDLYKFIIGDGDATQAQDSLLEASMGQFMSPFQLAMFASALPDKWTKPVPTSSREDPGIDKFASHQTGPMTIAETAYDLSTAWLVPPVWRESITTAIDPTNRARRSNKRTGYEHGVLNELKRTTPFLSKDLPVAGVIETAPNTEEGKAAAEAAIAELDAIKSPVPLYGKTEKGQTWYLNPDTIRTKPFWQQLMKSTIRMEVRNRQDVARARIGLDRLDDEEGGGYKNWLKRALQDDRLVRWMEFKDSPVYRSLLDPEQLQTDFTERAKLSGAVLAEIGRNQPRNAAGQMVSPNTGAVLGADTDIGHKAGFEHRRLKRLIRAAGITTEQDAYMLENDAGLYQFEPSSENRSHKFEKPGPVYKK